MRLSTLTEAKSKKVFLGGTCNDSTWRDELIPMLEIEYFNPVVDDWTEEAQAEEIKQRKTCDFCLYVITTEMAGYYSIAEAVDDSNKRPEKIVFCVVNGDKSEFDAQQTKSFDAIGKMIEENGGTVVTSLKEVAEYLNGN